MGMAKGLKKLAEKTVPGGDWTPGGQIHRGINKGLGIEPGFAQPDVLSKRIEANRTGDSQWQKINPKNLRDYNMDMGYNYKEGGRDPKPRVDPRVPGNQPQATTQPVGGTGGARVAPQRRPNMMGMAQSRMMGQAQRPMQNPMMNQQRAFAQQMRQPTTGMRPPPNPTGRRF